MYDRSMPMASRVSAYMRLRLLPLSISTLVRRFVLKITSTPSRHLHSCGMLLGWSDRSKVMADSDYRINEGVAGSAA
jgi:hypothetical protein